MEPPQRAPRRVPEGGGTAVRPVSERVVVHHHGGGSRSRTEEVRDGSLVRLGDGVRLDQLRGLGEAQELREGSQLKPTTIAGALDAVHHRFQVDGHALLPEVGAKFVAEECDLQGVSLGQVQPHHPVGIRDGHGSETGVPGVLAGIQPAGVLGHDGTSSSVRARERGASIPHFVSHNQRNPTLPVGAGSPSGNTQACRGKAPPLCSGTSSTREPA